VSRLSELKTRDTDRKKISDWLDRIGESDEQIRDEVMDACTADLEARKYYVAMAKGELL